MSTKFTELHCKEVICVSDGRRLGYISDACVEIPSGNIQSIIVPCPCKLFGLLGRRDEYVIPWSRICRMGPDIVLVDVKPEECRVPRMKSGHFFG
jgi:YlmC/YmxH family sporulation protein